jgi:TM2 domain-containing membrane protein YozV
MSLSPDGKWLWDGTQWIPAPPTSEPPQSISNGSMPQATPHSAVSTPQQQIIVQHHAQPKSYGAALIFNFIWAGVGHMYLEQKGGLTMAIFGLISILTILLSPIYLIIWIISLVQTRTAHNNYLTENGFNSAV